MTAPLAKSVFAQPLTPITTAILLATALVAFDALSVITILPSIGADLGNIDLLSGVVTSFLIASAIAVLGSGPIIDAIGAQRVFRIGVVILIAASGAAAAAPSMSSLLVLRGIQGVGAGMAFTVALATAAISYPVHLRARMYAASSSVWGVASVVAPVLAALLLAFGNWRIVFAVTVPLAGVAALSGWTTMPERVPQDGPTQKFDLPGLALVAAFSATAVVALSSLSYLTAVLLPVALALAALYWWRSGRADSPVLERRFIGRRPLGPLNSAAALAVAAAVAVAAYLPLYVEGGLGRSTQVGAMALASLSLAWMFGAILSSRLLDRIAPLPVMRGGMVAVAASMASGFIVFASEPANLWLVVIPAVLGLGIGAATNAMIIFVQATVAEHERGRGAAGHQYMRTLGNTIGPAIGGALILLEVSKVVPDSDQLQAVLAGQDVAIGAAARLAVASGFRWAHAVGLALVVAALGMTRFVHSHPTLGSTNRDTPSDG